MKKGGKVCSYVYNDIPMAYGESEKRVQLNFPIATCLSLLKLLFYVYLFKLIFLYFQIFVKRYKNIISCFQNHCVRFCFWKTLWRGKMVDLNGVFSFSLKVCLSESNYRGCLCFRVISFVIAGSTYTQIMYGISVDYDLYILI